VKFAALALGMASKFFSVGAFRPPASPGRPSALVPDAAPADGGRQSTGGVGVRNRNFVLRALCAADAQALAAELRNVELSSGDVLYEPDYPVEWVYFPQTAVLSVVTVMADGRTVESDTVGCESVVGALAALGSAAPTSRTLTQIPGVAARLSASKLRHRADMSAHLRRLLVRHSLANLAQAHQSVACNALHGVNQRLCRWLLMSQDRTAKDVVELTHQYLATMVGVQRTTITGALRDLASAKVIRVGRRRIEILDRPGMESQACECYGAVQANLERLIGDAPPPG
jgi:CRP-like cAMP-binding protein